MTPGVLRTTDTVLFTDLVGFTEFTDAFGDAAAVEVLDEQSTIAGRALAGTPGRLVKEIGDGLMFWFADPGPALVTATSILRAIDDARAGGFPLGIRMGMHSGDVVTRGDDIVGHTVNVAARIVDLAGPGELVVSDSVVAGLDENAATFEPVGPARVKGVEAPVWLHRLAIGSFV